MEEEDAEHAIAIDATEAIGLTLSQMDETEYQRQEEQQHTGGAEESLLLADGAEDEVGVLLGHELQLGLGAVEESLALQSARTDGNLRLMNVVAGSLQVFVEAQEHIDARPLVRLHDILHDEVGTIVETARPDGEEGDEEVVAETGGEALVEDPDGQYCRQPQLGVGDDVGGIGLRGLEEAKDVGRQVGQQRETEGTHQHVDGLAMLAVDPHHSDAEQLDEQQDGETADGGLRAVEQHIGKADADNEIDDHGNTREEDGTRHALTIEHEEEGQIDEGRTGLALQHDAEHGQQDDGQRGRKVTPLVDVIAVGRHELRQGQRRGKLGKLGRL